MVARGKKNSVGGQRPILPAGRAARLDKSEGYELGERSLPLLAHRLPPLLSSVPLWTSAAFNSGTNGVQLRGHRDGGGQVPQPRPRPQQHDADRRGGVAQDDGEELVVRSRARPCPWPPRPQVRLRAGNSRRVLQVPAPPHQLPRPPGVPSVTGHHRVLVVVLPHRRGAVTERDHRNSRNQGRGGKIKGKKHKHVSLEKGAYLFLP